MDEDNCRKKYSITDMEDTSGREREWTDDVGD